MNTRGPREKAVFCQAVEISDLEQRRQLVDNACVADKGLREEVEKLLALAPSAGDFFSQVCNAVEHAHQMGIIHRDLKPSNIMVTMRDGVPAPKVIDFGIAKATEQSLTDKTLFTSYSQLMGTPAYMSPEQMELSGLGLDTTRN